MVGRSIVGARVCVAVLSVANGVDPFLEQTVVAGGEICEQDCDARMRDAYM